MHPVPPTDTVTVYILCGEKMKVSRLLLLTITDELQSAQFYQGSEKIK